MIFCGSKKVLFDNAYHEYREIINQTELVYTEVKDKLDLKEVNIIQIPLIAISVDIYIQANLFKIAISDQRISDDEKHFIRTLIDNSDILKKMPKYKSFLSRLDLASFERIKDDELYGDKLIPVFLMLSFLYDKVNSEHISYKLINSLEIIFNSFIELDDIQSRVEKKCSREEINRLISSATESTKTKISEIESIVEANKNNEQNNSQTLEELMEELNSLVGLDSVKRDIEDTINLIQVNKIRKKQGLKEIIVTNHLVFTGNPGTGKTTVARLVARIYKVLGVIDKGTFVETDRSGLVAGYVGQTAVKTKEMIEKAKGGVLFIDEAYALANNSSVNDFGHEAVDTIVKAMEDNRDNLVVIVAGYGKEMNDFINSNPGLSSRFSRYINFENYSVEELTLIFQNMCKKNGFVADEHALYALEQLLLKIGDTDKIGNARGIRNIFDKAVLNQAGRIMRIDAPSKRDLITFCKEDISSISMFGLEKKEKKKIGFYL